MRRQGGQIVHAGADTDDDQPVCAHPGPDPVRSHHRQHLPGVDGGVRQAGELPAVRPAPVPLLHQPDGAR